MGVMELIRAAGGVLWRGEAGGARVAVIHRPRRGDWSLPKGKLCEGERWEEAAVREVLEETGCGVRLLEFAASTFYVPNRTPKVVVFWNMGLVHEGEVEGDEVDELRWLKPRAALLRLDHENERHVLERAIARREARLRATRPDAVRADIAAARARLLRRGLADRIDGETLGMGLARLDQAEDAVLGRRALKTRAHIAAAARMAEGARARVG